jgi:hypothetical protein
MKRIRALLLLSFAALGGALAGGRDGWARLY